MSRLAHLAIRNRAMTVVAATTGLISLAATADGFVRSTGSFVAENFAAGMEITPNGFPSNAVLVVREVSPLTLYTTTAPTIATADVNRSITAAFPTVFGRENKIITPPTDGRGYAEESFEELTQRTTALSVDAPREFTGNMRFVFHAKADTGMLGLRTLAEEARDLFPKGWSQTLADGSIVRTRNDFLPTARHVGVLETGFSAYVVTIPWRLEFPA